MNFRDALLTGRVELMLEAIYEETKMPLEVTLRRSATSIWVGETPNGDPIAYIAERKDGGYDFFIRPAGQPGAGLASLREEPYPTFESARGAFEEWARTTEPVTQ